MGELNKVRSWKNQVTEVDLAPVGKGTFSYGSQQEVQSSRRHSLPGNYGNSQQELGFIWRPK